MRQAVRARRKRGRKATPASLRLLAALVAILLSASALGQAAHFLLVPHAICAEHGELLELDEPRAHVDVGHERAAEAEQHPHASPSEGTLEHEHCQVLARGQREQALPNAPTAELLPAVMTRSAAIAVQRAAPSAPLDALDLAPKTSPPRTPSC